ncbi:hypothetical protein ACFU98_43380 [Streptomyces sp. NPDC057575]|uniref:hypothetical protein n=1 Tax=unclassified Streptomyces TaxID=2593676 RepID=UPI003686BC6B
MANRLTAPAPLVRVGDWARTWAVEEVFVRGELDAEHTPSHWPDYVIVDGGLVIGGALGRREGDG